MRSAVGRNQRAILEKLYCYGPMKFQHLVKLLGKSKGLIGNSLKSLHDKYDYVYKWEGLYHITPSGIAFIRGSKYIVEREKVNKVLDELLRRAEAIEDEKTKGVLTELMLFLKTNMATTHV